MKNWQQTLIPADATLHDALEMIDRAGCQIVLVVDENRRLLGTLSDGDARRGLLGGLTLSDRVDAAMHCTPTCAKASEERSVWLASMRRHGLHQIPLLDDDGIVVGLAILNDFLAVTQRDNRVVIMAGGLGSRLKELTKNTPKPMLKVGSRPILETIVQGYAQQGFWQFHFAVNYKAEQIEAHFGDGGAFGVAINYLREEVPLGTAGALSLLPQRPTQPFIVTNADLLTKEDYANLLDQHQASQASASMVVREYEMQVPFGVVHEAGGYIQKIEEKPVQRFLVNAGIYVLSPEALDFVPQNTYFDMPSLFETLSKAGHRLRSHRIEGYWLDIGRISDYERANHDFSKVFS